MNEHTISIRGPISYLLIMTAAFVVNTVAGPLSPRGGRFFGGKRKAKSPPAVPPSLNHPILLLVLSSVPCLLCPV